MTSNKHNMILDRLTDNGFFCRRNAIDSNAPELAEAINVIWQHMCRLDSNNIQRWQSGKIVDIVNCVPAPNSIGKTFGDT